MGSSDGTALSPIFLSTALEILLDMRTILIEGAEVPTRLA
jgi:hypothetical protein